MEGGGGGGGGESCDDDHQHHLNMSEDVLIEILLCLPVISLLRFKSVCKSWRSIIESPFFINLQAITTKSGDGSSFIFKPDEEEKIGGDEHQKKKDEKICRLSGDEFEVFDDLGRPPPVIDLGKKELEALKRTHGRIVQTFYVVGCSNGIICLHDMYTRNVVLWNPAIKQSRRLPKPSNLLGNPNCYNDNLYFAEDIVAFGVDAKTKDYKVLLLTTLQPQETYFAWSNIDDDLDEQQMLMHTHSPRARRVHVYSLSTDSWRCIDNTLSDAHPIDTSVSHGVCLNGNHYFNASCLIKDQKYLCTRPLILSLDLTEEIFKTVPPPYDWWNKYSRLNCGSGWNKFIPFGEKPALVEGFEGDKCNVWVLDEEQQHSGVKEYSWTKLYTLRYSNYKLYTLIYSNYKSPISGLRCIADNGQLAIIEYWTDYSNYSVAVKKFRIMNLITGETKDLKSDGQDLQVDFGVGSMYRPSLVQIGRSGATTNEKCDSTL